MPIIDGWRADKRTCGRNGWATCGYNEEKGGQICIYLPSKFKNQIIIE